MNTFCLDFHTSKTKNSFVNYKTDFCATFSITNNI